ncbi:MAG: acetyl-CoA synthetase [Candidatus Diapherotrites archaeon]|nr:acetyl-CoA synthetase [Candidatus Diapherotrites archaeon]
MRKQVLSLDESFKLLKKYDIPLVKRKVATSATEAVNAAESIGFPVVMKVVSKDIIHKTDAGCVVTGVESRTTAKAAFKEIVDNAKKFNRKAVVDGVDVEKTRSGRELIVGGKQDPQFGPIVLFGLGGVFVEAFEDFSIRLAPVSKSEAREMIKELRGSKVLGAFRGQKPVDVTKLVDVIVKASELMAKEPVVELDINPLMATDKKVTAVDARVVLGA